MVRPRRVDVASPSPPLAIASPWRDPVIFDPNESHQLTGTHAALYRESLGVMLDVFREALFDGSEDYVSIWSFGVTLFDELHWQQQLSLLLSVSRCALNGSGDPEEWNALEKASFYAVYRNVLSYLEIERDLERMDASEMDYTLGEGGLDLEDDDDDYDDYDEGGDEGEEDAQSWQELITAAYQEKCLREGLTPEEIEAYLRFTPDGDGDLQHWFSLLESLADQTLDDRDFEMAATLMDVDPEIATVIKTELGIQPDYFIATADEPSSEAVSEMFQELAQLAGVPVAGDLDDDVAPF
ncbi:hypothetical protein NZK35_04475 [Stieleria sp. ICT_E10.1]|uniref:hypothetical protein n=1 Tax=Stieleria sedimenti TaxID=2976331 RepID=UPI00218059D4|nr:hypothetical protein [Stieleria sedimenti]MCS7465926.1 hypothetical protein [Stieleria sedimenti]